MPRSPGQSDFTFDQPVEPELARAALQAQEASAGSTRWVMGVTFFVLIALAIICAVGPHIPTGE